MPTQVFVTLIKFLQLSSVLSCASAVVFTFFLHLCSIDGVSVYYSQVFIIFLFSDRTDAFLNRQLHSFH